LDIRLASGGGDGQIKLWPRDSVGEPMILRHGSPVWSLEVLADGRLASGGGDGQIKLWPRLLGGCRRRDQGKRRQQPRKNLRSIVSPLG